MASAPTTFTALAATSTFSSPSVQVSGGQPVLRISSATASIDFASMAANARSVVTAALSAAVAGDTIVHNLGSNWSLDYTNIDVISQCTINGVISFTASNKSAGVIDPAATVVRYTAFGF